MLIKLECRIPKSIKQKIINKISKSDITISEFIRNIIDDIDTLNTFELKNLSSNIICDDKIRFKLPEEKVKLLNQICADNKCNISQLVRVILDNENYVINQFEYLTLCEFEMTRAGTILNNIAHELNRKALLLDINNESYEVVIARLIEPSFIINNVIILLSNPPLLNNELTNQKIMYQRKTQLHWASKIYRITNNTRQIVRRMIIDYENGLLSQDIYYTLVVKINELETNFQEIFLRLKIFHKIMNTQTVEI